MAQQTPTAGGPGADLVPPHDTDAEMSVLGACMLSSRAIDDIADKLHTEDFYSQRHRTVYDCITDMHSQGKTPDVVSVASVLESTGRLEGVGGKSGLLKLVDSCPLAGNVIEYAGIVRERSKSRQLIGISTFMAACGYDGSDPDDAISASMSAIMGLSMATMSNAMPVKTAIGDLWKLLKAGKQPYIAPPLLPKIHAKPGDLVGLAAGTSIGKTAVAVEWADWWSGGNPNSPAKKVYFFEYEMDETSLVSRMVSKHAGISMTEMDDGLDADQMERVLESGKVISTRSLSVENVHCDIGGLMAKVRRAAMMGAEVVMLDHLGLIPFKVPNGMNHAKAVGFQVTNKLKRLASELGIVIVLLIQLNRDGQNNTGWKQYPTKKHLRDSGEIEQDCSHIIMLYRYPRIDEDEASFIRIREELGLGMGYRGDVMWFGIEKNRNGPAGGGYGHHVGFDGETFSFSDLEIPRIALPEGVVQLDSIEQLGLKL